MERIPMVLTAVHVLGAIAWLCGMIFHIVVLDPVFRKNEVNFQGAFLLALMEQRFRKLVGTSIVLLVGSGFARPSSSTARRTTPAGDTPWRTRSRRAGRSTSRPASRTPAPPAPGGAGPPND